MQQQQPPPMAKLSVSILVMSLPLLYVSFLHVPPSALFKDTTFWFLMSNSIIIIIAADSGMLSSSPSSASGDVAEASAEPAAAANAHALAAERPREPVAATNAHALVAAEKREAEARPRLEASQSLVVAREEAPRLEASKSLVVAKEEAAEPAPALRRSATEENEYWRLSDEELNRRVEEFIRRFNREIRLQVEEEAVSA